MRRGGGVTCCLVLPVVPLTYWQTGIETDLPRQSSAILFTNEPTSRIIASLAGRSAGGMSALAMSGGMAASGTSRLVQRGAGQGGSRVGCPGGADRSCSGQEGDFAPWRIRSRRGRVLDVATRAVGTGGHRRRRRSLRPAQAGRRRPSPSCSRRSSSSSSSAPCCPRCPCALRTSASRQRQRHALRPGARRAPLNLPAGLVDSWGRKQMMMAGGGHRALGPRHEPVPGVWRSFARLALGGRAAAETATGRTSRTSPTGSRPRGAR